jgi:hypothetical protein
MNEKDIYINTVVLFLVNRDFLEKNMSHGTGWDCPVSRRALIQIFHSLNFFSMLANQAPFYSNRPSSFTAVNDELVPLVCKLKIVSFYFIYFSLSSL